LHKVASFGSLVSHFRIRLNPRKYLLLGH
jgi:hypothetical protein